MGHAAVSPTSFYPAYIPPILNYAATHGGIRTQIAGNPLDVPKGDLERAITNVLAGSQFGPPVPFVITRPEDIISLYRAMPLFDHGRRHETVKLCRQNPGAFDLARTSKLRIH